MRKYPSLFLSTPSYTRIYFFHWSFFIIIFSDHDEQTLLPILLRGEINTSFLPQFLSLVLLIIDLKCLSKHTFHFKVTHANVFTTNNIPIIWFFCVSVQLLYAVQKNCKYNNFAMHLQLFLKVFKIKQTNIVLIFLFCLVND